MATGWGRRSRVDYCSKTIVGQTPSAAPTTWFASLHTANPADDGQTAGEVSTTTSGYARQTITWNTLTAFGSLTVDTASTASNSALITFGPSAGASAAWGTITYAGVWTSSTLTAETSYLGRALASSSQSVGGAGISITIAANALTMGIISA
jgi:hypothetical protein